jgi:hypothetical protein
MTKVAAWGLAALGLAGCGTASGPSRVPDPSRPWKVLAAEYSVPIVLGLTRPGSVGGWDESPSLDRWVRGWTQRPRPDDVDSDFINYVLHPLAGSETHMLARNHGWSFGEAVLFDFAGSLSWEYVFENVFERPSRTDLLVTAPVGALLGELRWWAREAGVLPGLMDPFGGHGEPFIELAPEGLLFGLDRRF